MFKNLKLVYLGSNEILAYNDMVAGIFNDYRTTSTSAIHQLENRKLTDAEIDQFLDEIDQVEKVEDETPAEETDDVLNKIMRICPEVKYIIHGIKTVLAAGKRKQSPEERRQKVEELKKERESAKKGTEKKIKKSEKIKERDKTKRAKEIEREKKRAEKEKAKTPPPEEAPPETPPETPPEETEETPPEESQEDKDRRAEEEQKRFEREEQEKANREKENKRVEKGEEDLSKVGEKAPPKYTGFKGLMFNMYKTFFTKDPENEAEKKALQQRLRRDWAMYKENKTLFEKNKELMDELGARVEQKEISPETISLINEAVKREPKHLKEIDFSEATPSKPISVYLVDLAKIYKDIKASETDRGRLERNIKNIIEREEKIKILRISIIYKKEREHGRLLEIEVGDWDSYYKLLNKIED